MVPLNITYYLLRKLMSTIRYEILALSREDDAAELLQETHEVASQRVLYKNRLERLKRAAKELAKFWSDYDDYGLANR